MGHARLSLPLSVRAGISGAGGGGGAAAGAVAGGSGDGGSGSAGTERRRPTARQSPAPADSPWEPLWTAACPCRWRGVWGVGGMQPDSSGHSGGRAPPVVTHGYTQSWRRCNMERMEET